MRIALPFYTLLVLIFICCDSIKPAHYLKIAGFAQGTTFHITYQD